MNRISLKEDIMMTSRHMQKSSPLVIVREVPVKNSNEISPHTRENSLCQKVETVVI